MRGEFKGMQIKNIIAILPQILSYNALDKAPVAQTDIPTAGDGVRHAEDFLLGKTKLEKIIAVKNIFCNLFKAFQLQVDRVPCSGKIKVAGIVFEAQFL